MKEKPEKTFAEMYHEDTLAQLVEDHSAEASIARALLKSQISAIRDYREPRTKP